MRAQITRAVFAAALATGLLQQASAVPMLRLETEGATVTIGDGSAGDATAAGDGVVLFLGGLGNWFLNVAAGISKPALGSADAPELDLNSLNLSSSGAATTVNVWLTDTDFTAKSAAVGLVAAIGGTTSGTISYRTFYDSSNTAFGTANEITSVGPLGGLAFASTASDFFSSATSYSLTLLVSITHGAGGSGNKVSSFDAAVKVPEPSSLLLLGAGLLAVGFAVRRSLR
jgi:hypothetical protein